MTECSGAGSPLAGLEEWYGTPLGFEVGAREERLPGGDAG